MMTHSLMAVFRVSLVVCLFFFVASCARWSSEYETPQINVISVNFAADQQGINPRFVIGLEVINPNRQALDLKGMSYQLEVEGQRILTGAKADLPMIEAYSSERFTIEASADLLGSSRLIAQLFAGQHQHLDYIFKAKLDAGRLLPFIRVEESGQLDLVGKAANTQ